MTPNPAIDLEKLREVGRAKWDVITTLGESAPPATVTDPFLLAAAGLICDGADDGTVADYIIDVSTECLGVDTGSGIRERALSLVGALKGYLRGIHEEPA